jgi:DNA-binding response OmpR family regulator
MHVRRLRAKLRASPERGPERVPRITAVRGLGYRMDAPAEEAVPRTRPAA